MASAGGDARLNLEAWSRDLLGDAQLENVAHLAAWCQQSDARTARTSHEEEEEEDEESNNASTSRLPPDDRDNTAAVLGPSSSAIKLPSEPITSSSALLPWLESIKPPPNPAPGRAPSSTMTSSTPAQLSHIISAAERTTSLLSQLESARINVAELKAGSRSVEETAEELRNESESSSSGRTSSHHLSHLVSTLDSHLSYYSILPQATQFLSSPNLNQVVLSERFGPTMAQCDAAYEFVRARPHWRDAAVHRLRFEHCITRGGTLARMWVVGRFKELGAQVITGLKERGKALPAGGQDGTLMEFADAGLLGILYPSYVNAAQEVRSVLAEITKRCTRPRPRGGEHGSNQDTTDADGGDADGASSRGEPLDESSMLHDYQGAHLGSEADEEEDEIHIPTFTEFDTLLSDCRAAYFDSRRNALLPLIGAALAKIEGRAAKAAGGAESETQSQSPLVLFLSQSLKMLTPLLGSEYRLYTLFFDIRTTSHAHVQGAPQGLLDFLSSLSKELSDRLHPRIYAESRLSELARLAETVLEAGHDDEHEGKMPSLFSVNDPHDFTALLPRWEPAPDHQGATAERTWLHGPLVKPVYSDIAARLTFRARAILQGRDVAGYTPADEGEMLHAIRAIKARAADAEVDVHADVQSKGRRKRKARDSSRSLSASSSSLFPPLLHSIPGLLPSPAPSASFTLFTPSSRAPPSPSWASKQCSAFEEHCVVSSPPRQVKGGTRSTSPSIVFAPAYSCAS
ncbi:hypothetical protein BDZ90DRAFT_181858 [Jaminaea rosea]|uniref:Conserved oligomeric Golgi complex subunit 3 n=1 Tax=Jaminaea rosea TaxID=1569628 RepID=A0A316UUF8_9BASI|nr:hypothetical protein BDZ90DRAFT_181858 [Jaminaea rosea]PWN27543.1 hypothetical protein BDZ90DRAFT_181858 [Jaminaea rosea]